MHEYEAHLPSRLKAEELGDAPLLNLMMRCEGPDNPDAYLAPVWVKDLRRALGGTSLAIVFVDQDLRGITSPFGSTMTADDMWRPIRPLSISERRIKITTGYFMPYESSMPGDTSVTEEELELLLTR